MIINTPTKVLIGINELQQLTEEIKKDKVLIVTSKSARVLKTDIFQMIKDKLILNDIPYYIYSNVETNPTKEQVDFGTEICKKNGCTAVLGIGGGSVIDVSKAICFSAVNNDFWNFVENPEIDNNGALKLLIMNTSAGTGSEINSCAVITNENKKMALVSDSIFPKMTFIIPELMTTISLKNTYYQLLDCLYHAIESYLSINSNPYSMSCSETCIRLTLENFDKVMTNPANKEIRENLAIASLYSGYADMFGGCLSIHSLGHAICAFYPEILHGEAIALLSEAYYNAIQDYGDEKTKQKLDKLNDIFATSLNIEKNDIFSENLRYLYSKYEIMNNKGLYKYGIEKKDYPNLVKNAKETVGVLFENDPVDMKNNLCIEIFEKSK